MSEGSPPQVRGKLELDRPKPYIERITPAGAGKTRGCAEFRQSGWDHPRRCGENYWLSPLRRASAGSPPQVRGKLGRPPKEINQKRITPAGAGKTCSISRRACCSEDHPRRCGENFSCNSRRKTDRGSPPQVRGKRLCRRHSLGVYGITPAGAGKTCRQLAGNLPVKDHPRRCGENDL